MTDAHLEEGDVAVDEPCEQEEATVPWARYQQELAAASAAYGYAQAQLAAVKLALEFDGLTPPDKILKVVARLVRDVAVDPRETEPTRLLIDAVRTERR